MSVLINKTHSSFLVAILKRHIESVLKPSLNEIEKLNNHILLANLSSHIKNSIMDIEQLCYKLNTSTFSTNPLLLHEHQKKLLSDAYQGYVARCKTRSDYINGVINDLSITEYPSFAQPEYQSLVDELVK